MARLWARKFAGFSFTMNKEPKRRITPNAVARFKERIRELTSRTRGVSIERMATALTCCLRGWPGDFGKCQRRRCWKVLTSVSPRIKPGAECVPRSGSSGNGVQNDSPNSASGVWAKISPFERREVVTARGGWRIHRDLYCDAQCLLRPARDSEIDCSRVA